MAEAHIHFTGQSMGRFPWGGKPCSQQEAFEWLKYAEKKNCKIKPLKNLRQLILRLKNNTATLDSPEKNHLIIHFK